MTSRGLYEALLIELNKVEAPSLLLEDYNYFLNRAIYEYINKRYTLYDTSQQTTDDLQVLTDTFTVNKPAQGAKLQLPDNYFHLLNCTVVFRVVKPFKIYPAGSFITQGARKLTAEKATIIENNAFLKPEYRRPYYYITNALPVSNKIIVAPKIEIRAGKYSPTLEIEKVSIDYLKMPQQIVLTEAQRDDQFDTSSQTLEFPDYVTYEIIKNLTALILENSSDERLKTHPQINTSIPQDLGTTQGIKTANPDQQSRQTLQQR